MSPFLSSLLALAALLATANGYCSTKHVGEYSENYVDFDQIDFMPPGITVNIDRNYCTPPMQVVGEDITTCNKDQYGTAPTIEGPDDGWSPFNAVCSVYDCPAGGDVNIRQYCDYI